MSNKTYEVKDQVKHGGKYHKPGASIELSDAHAAPLLKSGAITLPAEAPANPDSKSASDADDLNKQDDAATKAAEKLKYLQWLAGLPVDMETLQKLDDLDLKALDEINTAGSAREDLDLAITRVSNGREEDKAAKVLLHSSVEDIVAALPKQTTRVLTKLAAGEKRKTALAAIQKEIASRRAGIKAAFKTALKEPEEKIQAFIAKVAYNGPEDLQLLRETELEGEKRESVLLAIDAAETPAVQA